MIFLDYYYKCVGKILLLPLSTCNKTPKESTGDIGKVSIITLTQTILNAVIKPRPILENCYQK